MKEARKIEILCTLGPSSLKEGILKRLQELNVSLFRINLSHTSIDDLGPTIEFIQKFSSIPICLDLEGAQIRTGRFKNGTSEWKSYDNVRISRGSILGNHQEFNLYPDNIYDELRVGDILSVDFDKALIQISQKKSDHLVVRVMSGGLVGSNKAITVHNRSIGMPFLTSKDQEGIQVALSKGIKSIALSFAQRADDVTSLRKLVPADISIISKIECMNGYHHLERIALLSNSILIDRGDFSRTVPFEKIPFFQKDIITKCLHLNRPVYVATNLLESMVTNNGPTRAEINDVVNTLLDGAGGLVLAAETAIGKDPIGCVKMIKKIIHEVQQKQKLSTVLHDTKLSSSSYFLIEPHGGELVQRTDFDKHKKYNSVQEIQRLKLPYSDLIDCEQIAVGTYSPLEGFMSEETLFSVLDRNCLPSGEAWTMPLLLQYHIKDLDGIGGGTEVLLCNENEHPYAHMKVSDVFKIEREIIAKKWFGTASLKHPGVNLFFQKGEYAIAGEITLLDWLPNANKGYYLTPAESRFLFDKKGWSKIVGFHTRNIAHRAHEYIQLAALERTQADGLYITPVIGAARLGDFRPSSVLSTYQVLLSHRIYPEEKVALGSFMTYPRFAGPREAIFTALCRKNMGCSHFIIGRNHAGVGDFYSDSEYYALFDRIGDIGIQPIFFDEIGYDIEDKQYKSVISSSKGLQTISGSLVRKAILDGKGFPDWLIREEVGQWVQSELLNNRPIIEI